MVNTCPECSRVMHMDTTGDRLKFICHCGISTIAKDDETRILTRTIDSGSNKGVGYENLIKNSSFDRVNNLVKKDCPKCSINYMTQIRIGEDENIIYTCKCGYNSIKAK